MTSPPATASPPTPQGAPRYEAAQEVRFAVVIYGGVSLAIYINGIVQEMLRLVQATAPRAPGTFEPLQGQPEGSTKVYRKLGQLLGGPDPSPADVYERLKKKGTDQPPIRTRFVIDILSGTSAGGINAVFLAKALANNQGIGPLENTWVDEGDIEALINDRGSLRNVDNRLALDDPPPSLLNGRRMYLKLLQALDDMHGVDPMHEVPPTDPSPLVERLDLFCTATDLRGLRRLLPLSDAVVDERQYRKAFRFQYRAPRSDESQAGAQQASAARSTRNDFLLKDNPFLAYAARCTSAFPFAFEPMTLADIFPIVRSAPRHRNKPYGDPKTREWERFYDEYTRDPDRVALPFDQRSFGDGGYLDNKPFSYAIETTLQRHPDLPLQRKLVYIEPDPVHPADVQPKRPDAIENSLDALVVLPRDETIRTDLERLVDRNIEIERIGRVLDEVAGDLKAPAWTENAQDWLDQPKAKTLEVYGARYSAYERLKLSDTTDQLARLVAKAFRVDPKSGNFTAIRALIGRWRAGKGLSYSAERRFALNFDVDYRLRRLRYIARYINELLQRPEPAAGYRKELRRILQRLGQPRDDLQDLVDGDFRELGGNGFPMGPEELKRVLSPPSGPAERSKMDPDGLMAPEGLEASEAGTTARADFFVGKYQADIQKLADAVQKKLEDALKKASDLARQALLIDPALAEGPRRAREDVDGPYRSFESYDSVVFPITFGRELGENEPVGIHRISPDDAKARADAVPANRDKLKGTALGAFGGFLDRSWRQNDILWGRLDGAERLIGILIPAGDEATKKMRDELVDEAHREIVWEFLHERGPLEFRPLLGKSADECTDWKRLLTEFVARVPEEPTPELVARSATRSAAVTGHVFEAIADARRWEKKPFGWLATVGQLAWGLVEASTPGSVWSPFASKLIKLLFYFGVAAAVAGLVGGGVSVVAIGVLGMLCASVAFVLQATLTRWMQGLPPLSDPLAMGVSTGASVLLSLVLFFVPRAQTLLGRILPADFASATSPVAWLDRTIVAGLAVTLLSGLSVLLFWLKIERTEGGSRTPLLRLCVARTWIGVKNAIGERWDPTRKQVRTYANVSPLFVGGYVFVMALLGVRLGLDGHVWGSVASFIGVAAGVAHLRENTTIRTLSERELPPENERSSAASPAAWPGFAVRWLLVLLALGAFVAGAQTSIASGSLGVTSVDPRTTR